MVTTKQKNKRRRNAKRVQHVGLVNDAVCLNEATKVAGRIAGLDEASLAYGFEKKNNDTILDFDLGLGGRTFDVSVLEVGDGVFEVLSTSGDTHLGGDDFDKRMVDWLAQNFKRGEGIDLLKDKQALQRLIDTAEKAKMELSSLTQTCISLPLITATVDGPKHIDTTLTRVKFKELCSDLLDRNPCWWFYSHPSCSGACEEDDWKRAQCDCKS